MTGRLRVGICPDFREEGWPSMDRVADELLRRLARDARLQVRSLCPPYQHRAARVTSGRLAANIDRGLNRLIDYPAHAARLSADFDVFHVVDHSYAQLVHRLPAERTVVTCHDLDTFRSVLTPDREPRSALFRTMTRRILRGVTRAAVITCDTSAVRSELIDTGLVRPERVVVVPIGVDAVFSHRADAEADAAAVQALAAAAGAATGTAAGAVDLLHVGSVAPRKRIDLLLETFAAVSRAIRGLRLIRVGGAFTPEQQRHAERLGIADRIVVLPPVSDRTLAALYRRAAVTVLPSAREGFGLPVVESLACGTPVVASDLPVLREVGGAAVEYCAPGDVHAWVGAVLRLLDERAAAPHAWMARTVKGTEWAARYTWVRFAERMTTLYLELADAPAARRVA